MRHDETTSAAPTVDPLDIPAGTLIADTYRVVGQLGSGGEGRVLLAIDQQLGRDVAIKVLRRNTGRAKDRLRERVRAEARAMARVHHPNVVQVFEYREHEGTPLLIMERFEGVALSEWLETMEGARLPRVQAASIIEAICRGVGAVHQAGLLHGDLKPSNVLVAPAHQVAVADFGLAAALSAERVRKGSVVGTPAYMAPEVVAGLTKTELAVQIDVFALGIIAFELLESHHPFLGSSVESQLALQTRAEVPPMTVAPEIEQVVRSALARDPRSRPASADALRRAFARAFKETLEAPADVKLLVADDDPVFRLIARELAHNAFPGVQVQEAGDGAEALRAAKSSHFDVALVDLQMPGLDGIELTTALQSLPRPPLVAVITAHGGARDWQQLRELGAQAFFVKPVDPHALALELRRLVADSRADMGPAKPGPAKPGPA